MALVLSTAIFNNSANVIVYGASRMSGKIKIGIIGGTGLDNPVIFKNRIEKKVTTPFGDPSDVLLIGDIEGILCVLLARHGRAHDIIPGKVNYRANIWALKNEGCTHIVASTATGSLKEEIKPGDLVIVDNFIDRTQGRKQSFYDGSYDQLKGLCHMPMEPSFCEKLRQVILNTAKDLEINCHPSGTVIAVEGPRFSSRAESFMFIQWGAHIINMTSLPEIVLAKEVGISYAQIAMATDYDCWRSSGEKVSHELVLKTFAKNVDKVIKLICSTVVNIGKENWDEVIKQNQECVKNSIYF